VCVCVFQMWACALGHQRAAALLYRWNSSALGLPDSLGRLPLAVARSRGHTLLATALEELHTAPRDTPPPPRPSPSPPSTSPDTGNLLHADRIPVSRLALTLCLVPPPGLSSSSSLPSSPSPSSAYSSGPAPMDTSPSSLSSSSLPVSPPSPLPESVWGGGPSPGKTGTVDEGPGLMRDQV